MDCLIELYNNDQISNLISIFSFAPKKVILLYDQKIDSTKNIDNLRAACLNKMPNTTFEYVNINSSSIDKVTRLCTNLIHKNPNCYFDITGASELGVIGAYLACKKTFTPIFKLNSQTNKLVNIYGCHSLEKDYTPPNLTIDTILTSHGTSVAGYNHPSPLPEWFDKILLFCDEIFRNPSQWKDLCYYLQIGSSHYPQNNNKSLFWAPQSIKTPKVKVNFSSKTLLKNAEQLKLIRNLDINNQTVSFIFANEKIKKYMTDFGVWLELFCYIKLKQCSLFHDVRLSVKIDWDNTQSNSFIEVVNEIDLTFFYKTQPCFISCKLSEPSSDALQELSMYPSYFGGKNSKPILVVLNTVNKKSSYIYKRSKIMNIYMIDGNDIKNGNFINCIKSALNISN